MGLDDLVRCKSLSLPLPLFQKGVEKGENPEFRKRIFSFTVHFKTEGLFISVRFRIGNIGLLKEVDCCPYYKDVEVRGLLGERSTCFRIPRTHLSCTWDQVHYETFSRRRLTKGPLPRYFNSEVCTRVSEKQKRRGK